MKWTHVFIAGATLLALNLTSCGGDATQPTAASDSTSVNTPEDLKKLNEEITANPSDASLYHKRAKYFYEKKDYLAGLADMTRATSIDSSKAAYFLTLSDLYFVTNQTGNSKRALEKAVSLDSKNTDALLKLAELYLYVKQSDKSIEYINKVLKIDQYNSKAYFMKGMNYKDLKDTARAISSMQTAVEQDQQYYQAFMQLGVMCAAQGNPLAVQYYKDAMRIQPKSIEAWYDLGKYYQDVEDWNNALGAYNGLVQIEPSNKFAHYNMAVIYWAGLHKIDLALEHFNKAIGLDGNYAEAYYGRGICYQSMGNKSKALEDLQQAVAINPQFQLAQDALRQLQGGKK